jgi:acetate kinase
VGHRVAHGGDKFTSSIVINDEVIGEIDRCTALAPLHNPPNLDGIKAVMKLMPGVPNVAIFDTAFSTTMPPHVFT